MTEPLPSTQYTATSTTQPAVFAGNGGVSDASLNVARMIDRVCKAPGTYVIELERSPYHGAPLDVSISKVETIRVVKVAT